MRFLLVWDLYFCHVRLSKATLANSDQKYNQQKERKKEGDCRFSIAQKEKRKMSYNILNLIACLEHLGLTVRIDSFLHPNCEFELLWKELLHDCVQTLHMDIDYCFGVIFQICYANQPIDHMSPINKYGSVWICNLLMNCLKKNLIQ